MISRSSLGGFSLGILTSCALGFAVSYYAYVVEVAMETNKNYEAMCDISEHISCTKAFASEYGKGFGIIPKDSALYVPNSVYGLAYYTIVGSFSLFDNHVLSLIVVTLAILSNVGTIYLAYILYLLKDICVVCVSLYFINAIILTLAVKKYRRLIQLDTRKKKTH